MSIFWLVSCVDFVRVSWYEVYLEKLQEYDRAIFSDLTGYLDFFPLKIWQPYFLAWGPQFYPHFLVFLCISAVLFFLSKLRFHRLSIMLCGLSRVQLFATPRTVACQAPLSMEFSRQEYWSKLSFPTPGYLPDPGIKPTSPALQASWEAPQKPTGLHLLTRT